MTVMVTMAGVPDLGDAHAMDVTANEVPIATPATTACMVAISIFVMINWSHVVLP